MADTIFKYPLDLAINGFSETNKVKDELHTLGDTTKRIFISDYGPFYTEGVVVVDKATGKELKRGDQWTTVHPYREASIRTGRDVAAGIYVKDLNVGPDVLFTAHLVGGEFSYSYYALKQIVESLQIDDRPVSWDQILGKPSQFTPSAHFHSLDDTYGWEYVVAALYDVSAAIREGDVASRALLLNQLQAKLEAIENGFADLAQLYSDAADELAAIT